MFGSQSFSFTSCFMYLLTSIPCYNEGPPIVHDDYFFSRGTLSLLRNSSNCTGAPQHFSPITVVLCWCFTLQFRIYMYCATHKPTRMVFLRFHFWVNGSSASLVTMVTVHTSLMTCALACVSLVVLVTISDGHLTAWASHNGTSTTNLSTRLLSHLGVAYAD